MNENLKTAVNALSVAMTEISHVLIVLALFLFIAGIICINYFKGAFYKCELNLRNEDSLIEVGKYLRIGDKWECIN